MTIPELIEDLLRLVRRDFYSPRPREYFRDQRYLIAALATYAQECKDRGWHFDAQTLRRELAAILTRFRQARVRPEWLPIYLQNAIRRHVGERAEEIQAQARATAPKVARIVSGLTRVDAVIEPSATDLLASVYQDIATLRRQAAAKRREAKQAADAQLTLLK